MLPFFNFFNKCGVAFWTADLDTSLPAGDPDFLFADRTFVDVMGLALLHHVFLSGEEETQFIGFIQIPLVFCGTFIDVPGKHAEIGIDD